MNADSIKDLCFGIVGAQAAAAQAAHDARQPEVDRLKAINAQMLAALRAVAVALDCNTSQGGDLEKRLYKANPETPQAVRAAIASAERAGR